MHDGITGGNVGTTSVVGDCDDATGAIVGKELGDGGGGKLGDLVEGKLGDLVEGKLGDFVEGKLGDFVEGDVGDFVEGKTGDLVEGDDGSFVELPRGPIFLSTCFPLRLVLVCNIVVKIFLIGPAGRFFLKSLRSCAVTEPIIFNLFREIKCLELNFLRFQLQLLLVAADSLTFVTRF